MGSLLHLGQVLKGISGRYCVSKQLQDSFRTISTNEPVIIKSVRHFRIANENDILQRLQGRSTCIRPLVDRIVEPADPPAIVLRHLDDDLLQASAKQRLTKREVKFVAQKILEALKVLHQDCLVHTDVKPNNVLVNYKTADESMQNRHGIRFAEVQLADFGNTVGADSGHAKDGDMIGAPIWRSPEASLSIPWGCSTDIWSFGTLVISLLFGKNFHIFKPEVAADHEDYELKVLERMLIFFGPFPNSYKDIADKVTLVAMAELMKGVTPDRRKPFRHLQDPDLSDLDKVFLLKIMKMDPRDRPTAAQLLDDEWFSKEFE